MPIYGITHESGTLRKVLVHRPGKELELANSNPVEHNFEGPVDVARFRGDHKAMTDALVEAGVEMLYVRELVEDDPNISSQIGGCPNLVFTRDSSFVTDAGAVLMRMGLPSRRRETPIIEAAHAAVGVPVGLALGEPETFEGGGFALLEGRVAVAGLCQRTTQETLDTLGEFLLREGVAETFIELPGKLALVHTETLEYAPSVFRSRDETWEGSFVGWLEGEGWDILEISDRERMDMAANFLTVDRDLAIHYEGNPRVRARGIDVIQIPGEEMKKGNGGIHCMTCPILRV